MDDFRIRFFAPATTLTTDNVSFSGTSPSAGTDTRFSGRKQSVLVLLLACAAVIFILFSPRPALTSSEALVLVKTSRTLSPEKSNEEFVAVWKEAVLGRGGPKWDVEPLSGSGYLVSCLYKDGEGDLKGWFFEVLARERIVRRITRSLGDFYSRRIDDVFFRYSLDVTEDEMVTSWVQEAKIPSGKQTVLEKIAGELSRTGVRKEYGWISEPLGGGKWLVGFAYESPGDPEGERKGWEFQVDTTRKDFFSSFSARLSPEGDEKDDLVRLVRETGGVHLFSVSPPQEETKLTLESFLGTVLKRYGDTAEMAKKRFGPPRTQRRKNMTSIHDESYKYVITTLTWPGLALDFFQAPDKESLVSVTVLDGMHPFGPEPGLRVGMPFSAAVKILGEPAVKENRSAVYSDEDGFYDLVFNLGRSGIIERMKLLVYMD